jgi:alcohol dehydrogenase class IV
MKSTTFVEAGAIQYLRLILKDLKCKNIFLVRGKTSFLSSGAKDELLFIYDKFKVVEFKDFSTNPKMEEAEIGAKLFQTNNCDMLLCVGGGSVIDMGKIIKYLLVENYKFSNIQYIAIPTTAGTGSEATKFAVVYINSVKNSIEREWLLPDYAIVDSNLLLGQSSYQMAVSGIDALSQGIESLWCINSTEISISYAEEAILLIWNNLINAIKGESSALYAISKGSHLAGKAINITKTTAAHALSYNFTYFHGLPHGHAVALFLPFFTLLHKNVKQHLCNDIRGSDYLMNVMKRLSVILKVDFAEMEFKLVDFVNDIGISINFEILNISYADYTKALEDINADRLKNNPIVFKRELVPEIYKFNNNNSN